jgi:hypothetical protein
MQATREQDQTRQGELTVRELEVRSGVPQRSNIATVDAGCPQRQCRCSQSPTTTGSRVHSTCPTMRLQGQGPHPPWQRFLALPTLLSLRSLPGSSTTPTATGFAQMVRLPSIVGILATPAGLTVMGTASAANDHGLRETAGDVPVTVSVRDSLLLALQLIFDASLCEDLAKSFREGALDEV